jgi:hypothetical protein
VTLNLVFTRPGVGNVAMNRTRFNESEMVARSG